MLIPINCSPDHSKKRWVYVVGQKDPAATLKITGTALPRANFSMAQIDLGKANVGQSPSASLTVAMEQGPVPIGLTQRIVSSNPDLEIQPTATSPRADVHAPQTYTVTLSQKAHLGHLEGKISSFWVSASDHKEYLAGTMDVTADVIGEITASPTVVGFGTVKSGPTATQQIILTGKAATELKATANSPYLTVQIKPLSADASRQLSQPFGGTSTANTLQASAMAVLEVSLAPNAPEGSLQSQITVTTSTGQRLTLPVYAIVAKSPIL